MLFHPLFKSRAIEAVRLQTRLMGHRLTPLYDHQAEVGSPDLLGHCTACGMRVRVDSGKNTLSGEALHLPCDHHPLRCAESSAWLIGKIPSLLLRRFRQVLERADEAQRTLFENGDFDPLNYSLLSRDGTWALCYEVRDQWDEPISEHNPQHPEGVTFLEYQVNEDGMKWARYTGPRLNPNGHENAEHWLVMPLESGECGWFYRTGYGVYRFRREHGVVGYYVRECDCTLEERLTEEELADAGEEAEEEVPAFNSGAIALFQGSDLPAQPLAYP